MLRLSLLVFFLLTGLFNTIAQIKKIPVLSNVDMANYLETRFKKFSVKENMFCPEAKIAYYDSILKSDNPTKQKIAAKYNLAQSLLDFGREKDAVALCEELKSQVDPNEKLYDNVVSLLALSYLRVGERENCVAFHSPESCIMPIQGAGIHQLKTGSSKAIENYEFLLTKNPKDYEAMWLLNIAHMTLGSYPIAIKKEWLIPNLDKNDTLYKVKPFTDVAARIGFDYRNCSGGLIVDDFNNDSYLDIVSSDWNLTGHMRFLINDKKGGFIDASESSNLEVFTGGLNMVQTDYNNDGYLDIFVLRGAWMQEYGEQANSLLKNNGNNTFTDVTVKSGLFSEYPTNTCVWRDFNNDGWVDVFIGNESLKKNYPCELYINTKNGKFTNVADKAGCNYAAFVKGVNSADFDNDGLQDIILSTFSGRYLLKNTGADAQNIPHFVDVTAQSGIGDQNQAGTFSTWFWDYDNDGWKDIFACGYMADKSMAYCSATDALGIENKGSKLYLYHNNGNGTFTNVSKEARLSKSIFAMGANFGDIDNDGYLDMYLGTGNPQFNSLMPNKLFRNMGDGRFADVTVSARVGNLQKGHGVCILDMDNDGDQDIVEEIGGAFVGDAFQNSFYLNPGQNNNNFIYISLEGVTSNKSALGSHIEVKFKEKNTVRSVHRDLNSGGSFGAAALRRDIGIGTAKTIDEITVTWAGSNKSETFKNIKANQHIKITEGEGLYKKIPLTPLVFKKTPSVNPAHCH